MSCPTNGFLLMSKLNGVWLGYSDSDRVTTGGGFCSTTLEHVVKERIKNISEKGDFINPPESDELYVDHNFGGVRIEREHRGSWAVQDCYAFYFVAETEADCEKALMQLGVAVAKVEGGDPPCTK